MLHVCFAVGERDIIEQTGHLEFGIQCRQIYCIQGCIGIVLILSRSKVVQKLKKKKIFYIKVKNKKLLLLLTLLACSSQSLCMDSPSSFTKGLLVLGSAFAAGSFFGWQMHNMRNRLFGNKSNTIVHTYSSCFEDEKPVENNLVSFGAD